MQILTNLSRYDWSTWFLGIMRSTIQGGAGGVIAGLLSMGIDPQHFNLTAGLSHVLEMVGGMFVLQGIFALCTFLQTHGAPDRIQEALASAEATSIATTAAIHSAQAAAPPQEAK